MKAKREPIRWHIYLAELYQLLLSPYGVIVETEGEVLSHAPRADIILIRREGDRWTEQQRAYLPDGIRDTDASHILIEFKKTQSLSADGVIQTGAYDIQLRDSRHLSKDELSSFIVCAKQPQRANWQSLGFEKTEQFGVYINTHPLGKRVTLISLNELPREQHNEFVALFASKQRRIADAAESIQTKQPSVPHETKWFLNGLLLEVLRVKGTKLMQQLTIQEIKESGRRYYETMARSLPPEMMKEMLSYLTLEQRLEGLEPEVWLAKLEPEERLAGLEPEERLAGLEPEERLAGLEPEERLAGLEPEERLAGLEPEERLAGLEPEERLAGLSPEDLAYLKKLLSGGDKDISV